jgi:hypothetical protein
MSKTHSRRPGFIGRAGGKVHRAQLVMEILEVRQLLTTVPVSWNNPAGGSWDVASNWSDDAVPALTSAVTIDEPGNVAITISSNVESIASITSSNPLTISGGGLSFSANSSLTGGITMTGGALTATGSGVTLMVTGTTSVSNASLYAQAGATLSLDQMTSYVADGNTFQADGANSELDVSGLASFTQHGYWDVDATNGGTLLLGGLTSLLGTQGISINDTGSSSLEDTALTNLNGVDVTLDGTDQQVASAWTTFTGSITLTGGSTTLSSVASANFSALDLESGSTLELPDEMASVTEAGALTIGPGSTLDVSGGLTLASSSTLDYQVGGAPGYYQTGLVLVGRSIALGGTFTFDPQNGFTPSIGQNYSPLKYDSDSGAFAAINGLTTGMIANLGASEFDLDIPASPTISWANPGSGYWDVATNWSTGVVPSSTDFVSIDTASAVTITIQTSDDIQIQGITTGGNDTLAITGGSLTVNSGESTLSGPLSMTGGKLTASGLGTDFTASAATTVSSASLYAVVGATLNAPYLTTYTSNSPAYLEAEGVGSVLDLSQLASETIVAQSGNEATDGGTLNLSSLTTLSGSGTYFIDTGGSILRDDKLTVVTNSTITIDGTDPQFDADWTSCTGCDFFVNGGVNTLPDVTNISNSELIVGAGTLALPGVQTLNSTRNVFQVTGGGVLDLSNLTTWTSQDFLDIYIEGGELNLSSLTSLTGTQDFTIHDIENGTILDGSLTALSGVGLTLDGTDSQFANSWTSFTGSITLTGGSQTFPEMTSATFSQLELDNAATLSLPDAAAQVTDTGDILIDPGGTLNLAGNLTLISTATLDEQLGGAPGSGMVSQIIVGGVAVLAGNFNVDFANNFTPAINQDFAMILYGSATGSFSSVNQIIPLVIADQTATAFELDTVNSTTLSWINPDGGLWDDGSNWSGGTVPTTYDDVTISTAGPAIIVIQPGDDITVLNIITSSVDTLSITGGSLTVTDGDSTLSGPLSMTGGSLTASGAGVSLTASGVTTDSAGSLYAYAGAILSVPNLTSFVSNSSTFQADGSSSELNVSALTSATQLGPWQIDATSEGTVNLGSLTSLISTQGISVIDTGGSGLLDGALTTLEGVEFTLDGTDSQVATAWTTFSGSITLTGGSQTLGNVSSATFSSINLAAGSTLDLPLDTGAATITGALTIDAGAKLSVAGNLTLTSASTFDDQIGGTPSSGQFGQIVVGGSAGLAGAFDLVLLDAFVSSIGQGFPVITFNTAVGAFSTLAGLLGPGFAFTATAKANSLDLVGSAPPPVFTADTPTVGIANVAYSYQFEATALGASAITFSATGLPDWAQLNASTGLLTGTPNTVGTVDFSVTASDGIVPNTTVNVALTVAGGGSGLTINVAAGATFTVPDGIYTDGTTLNVGAGATVLIPAGTFTGGVTFNVDSGAVVDLTDGGSPSYAGTLSGSGYGTVELSSGRLYVGTGGLTFDFAGSTFQWTDGQIDAGDGNLTNLGTMNLDGDSPKDFYNDGVLDNFGTIIQSGDGSLVLGTDGLLPTTLMNEASASYVLEGDGGVDEVSDTGFAPGQVSLDNAGFIDKTSGTSTSHLAVLGSITNSGTIEADSGTISLEPTLGISQIVGSSLVAGKWNAEDGASLQFPSQTTIYTNAANLTLSGIGATFSGISLNSNTGSLTLLDGADFATPGNLNNSGTLTVGPGSTLTVNGNETEAAAGTLAIQIGGTPSSGQFGRVAVTGTATLAGAFMLDTVDGFTASPGQDFHVMTFSGAGGSFSTVLGFGSTFSDALNPTTFDVDAFQSAADLQLTSVSGPTTATPGQLLNVSWQVSDDGPASATGNWQDSVYLSSTPTVSSTSILLGTELHTGGLSASGTYTASWTGSVPAVLPGDYYVVVQVDSLYQASDPDRSNNTLAAGSEVAISIPSLTIGTPASASFTATESNVYYELSAAAGSSFLLAMTGSAASTENEIYVSFNSLPTAGQAGVQSSLIGHNPTLAVPAAVGGTYYILVHHQSGSPGAFNLTVSPSGLVLLQLSPATVGNAGQATLTIDGLDLGPDTAFSLIGTGGTIAGTTSFLSSSTTAYATFKLSGVAPGTYELKAVSSDGTTSTLGGAVQVAAGGGPDVVVSTIRDSTLRAGRASVMYVQYTNTGNDDAGAPLITLISTPAVPIGLDPNQTPADVEEQVLGINRDGPAGVLPPGATFQFAVYFIAGNDPFDIELDVAGTSDSQPLEWDAVVPRISADVTDAANWPAVYAQLQTTFGTTWGQYISVLDAYAALLPASVGDPSDPSDVLQVAVNQAVAAVSTSISGVAVGTAPGVILAGNTITATNGTTDDVFTTNILQDGSFVFSTLTAGSYTFTVAGDLIDGSPAPVTVNAGQAVTGVTVTLDPEVTLSGQVTAGGAPVADADVSVWSASGTPITDIQTDANGNYAANFVPGTYTLIVSAQGLSRSYSDVTLAAGPQAINIALSADSAVSGTVTLSDGQSIQSVGLGVLGVLDGTEPDPYFAGSFSSGTFLLDSLTPGVYDFSISAPGYNAVTISGVQVVQGQTVNLGAVQLTPVDDVAIAAQVAMRNTYLTGVLALFNGAGAGPYALQIYSYYFTGPGVAKPFQTPTLLPVQDTTYTPSTAANPSVTINSENDPTDTNAFLYHPTTTEALTSTLKLITAALDNGGYQQVPKVAAWLQPFATNGTYPVSPEMLRVPVATVMEALNLGEYQDVVKGSPAADLWKYENQGSKTGGFTVPGLLAGGVSAGDSRVLTGDLIFTLSCDGTVSVTPDFTVAVNDNFVISSSGSGYVRGNPFVAALGYLEGLDLARGVSFSVTFDTASLKLKPGTFTVQPPERNPCQPRTGDCIPAQTMSCNPFTPVKPIDPNGIFGPAGYGIEGYIQPGETWLYTVDFENDGSAAAQDVTVTEQLATNLDWSTFQIGSFGFGSVNVTVPAGLTEYQTTLSYENTDGSLLDVEADLKFDIETGLLTATFNSLDPTTGEAPTGVFDGFLYPDSQSSTGSEGYVLYSVQPNSGLTTGTAIHQQASVIFDTNPALDTGVVTNTIDSSPPSSTVAALPGTTTTSSFTVSWSGTDGAGSGIADYNVYVSENGAAYTLWQSDTKATSATYAGQANQTYAFFSVATDNVGLVQPTPPGAQAITKIVLPAVTATPPPLVTVTSVRDVLNRKHQVTEVIVTFSGAVNANEAQLPAVYRLAMPGKKGSYTAKNATVIKLKSASYNPANDSVTLVTKKPFALTKAVQLEIDGMPPTGLQDSYGRYIDGDNNGTAGGSAIAILTKNRVTIEAAKIAIRSRISSTTAAIDALLAQDVMIYAPKSGSATKGKWSG